MRFIAAQQATRFSEGMMETRYHGFEDMKGFSNRDIFEKRGSALMIKDPVPTQSEPATVEELTEKRANADARLSLLIESIKAGKASPEEIASLSSVAADARQLAIDLESAEELAQQQKAASIAQANEERRQRFDVVLLRAKEQRTKFAQLYRETCLALGAFCSSVSEATALANSFQTVLGTMPADRNAVRELTEKPDPLPALLESGLKTTTSYGWDFNITVLPLHHFGENRQ